MIELADGRAGEANTMLEAILFGAAAGVLFAVVAGLRRWPWPYVALVGLGWGVVIAALRLSQLQPVEPALLVLVGGLGGSLATIGSERGERERKHRSALILSRSPSSFD
jgi:peptidoglycan/LPS O-acetylase OafA/YrhL